MVLGQISNGNHHYFHFRIYAFKAEAILVNQAAKASRASSQFEIELPKLCKLLLFSDKKNTSKLLREK